MKTNQIFRVDNIMNTFQLNGNNGIASFSLTVNSAKRVIYIAIGFTLGVLAINYINAKRCYY
ncbi:hypothetical protein Q4Q39_04460 [Flavivirga amylovorans]|uniref:Uncharacterized protein n=1 Tax=Flavivirga amylovorans TaxID=870486 RepID=A0ABT8WYC3_9FLAO|nr:hypothetical protein [Flavivirga amylovorans]MDO5986653.1 hypothetical protein [Flavivirga amylovorans]